MTPNSCLPTPPSQMTDEHLRNAIAFQERAIRQIDGQLAYNEQYVARKRERQQAARDALTQLRAEKIIRESKRRQKDEEDNARMAEMLRAHFVRPRPLCDDVRVLSPLYPSCEVAKLVTRIALLETSNMALAEKVALLGKRKGKVVKKGRRG